MALNPLFLHFFQVLEYLENRENMRLQFRYIRDTSNPFELPDEKFLKLFRLNKEATFSLIEELRGLVEEPTRKDTVPFYLQVSENPLRKSMKDSIFLGFRKSYLLQ
ncbi:uncharacterized protein LOC123306413 [Coccinella septempunctata]|uniref:uncharacterized protein LOC123306413 n=1 Tax=Coccinella septempunctata TaxID=41139 RepID=UPI001D0818BE|nr:uncharacterized protein LOC123306413 [Coccinella septempunctata]